MIDELAWRQNAIGGSGRPVAEERDVEFAAADKFLHQGFLALIAKDTKGNSRYFAPRPSATGYNPNATFFSNRGPNQASARYFYRDQLKAYLKLNGPYNPGLTAAKVPSDAVETSASGVDPHISKANAEIQAKRIAAVRRIPLARGEQLIGENTDGRSLGFLGEPGGNTTTLNQALDR